MDSSVSTGRRPKPSQFRKGRSPEGLAFEILEIPIRIVYLKVTNQAKIEKTSSYNLPCPLFRKEGNSPPFSKGRWGGIISGVYTIMDSLVILSASISESRNWESQ